MITTGMSEHGTMGLLEPVEEEEVVDSRMCSPLNQLVGRITRRQGQRAVGLKVSCAHRISQTLSLQSLTVSSNCL